jgi:hypothetical protein
MEKILANAEAFATTLKRYGINRVNSLKLLFAEKLSLLLSDIFGAIIVCFALFFCIFFISVALALVLGVWMSRLWFGFLAVGLIHFLVGIVFWTFRSQMLRFPIINSILKQLSNNNNEQN